MKMFSLAATGLVAGLLSFTPAVHAADIVAGRSAPREHTFYVGFGYGPTEIQPGSNQRSVEGIDFSLEADANDLGGAFYAGYWISPFLALEIGGRDYGSVEVPFTFHDPHDNTSGTGESEVEIDGFSASLLLGVDPVEHLRLFARAGMLSWSESLTSRFDIPGEPAIRRQTEMTGTGLLYGAGMNWRFESSWELSLQYEAATLDEDEVSMISLGLSYDFSGLLR